MRWLILTIISLILWGCWSIFIKLSLKYTSWQRATLISVASSFIIALIVNLIIKSKSSINTSALCYASIAGILGVLGTLAFNSALEIGKASLVTSVSALYPLVTLLLARILLNEKISSIQLIGIILAIIAIILMSSGRI